MVIATDDDPRYAQVAATSPASLPLSLSESGFAEGSCIAKESPCLSTLWFTVGGQELLISIKTGPLANAANKAVLGSPSRLHPAGLNQCDRLVDETCRRCWRDDLRRWRGRARTERGLMESSVGDP